MKKLKYVFGCVLLCGLISCSKDEQIVTTNTLMIGSEAAEIGEVLVLNYGKDKLGGQYDGYKMEILVLDKKIKSVITNDSYYDLKGNGMGVKLCVYGSYSSALEEGEYTISSQSPFEVKQISSAFCSNLFKKYTPTTHKSRLRSIKMKISGENPSITFTVEAVNQSGKNVEVSYGGPYRMIYHPH